MKLKKRFYFLVASYFRFFANISFRRWRPRVIAITGSVGKTTMLNLVECILKDRAHYSHDANSAYGIAFDILKLTGVTGSKLKWFYLFNHYFIHIKRSFMLLKLMGKGHTRLNSLPPGLSLRLHYGFLLVYRTQSNLSSK